MRTEIFCFVYNRTDLLPRQLACFRRYFKGEYNLNVVCDYRDDRYVNTFADICEKEGVNFYKRKSEPGFGPSEYAGQTLTWAYDTIMKGQDALALLVDNDMFLIEDFNMEEYMEGYDFAGLHQQRGDIEYIHPGIMLFNLKAVENYNFHFHPCTINGQMLDSGGGTYELMNKLKFRNTNIEYPEEFNGMDLKEVDEGYGFELHIDQKVLHARNSTGWHRGYQIIEGSSKNKTINTILDEFLCN